MRKSFYPSAFLLICGLGYLVGVPAVRGQVVLDKPARENSAALRPTIADLAYADKSPLQKLDLYLPENNGQPAPVVIWMHGGGFRAGDKRSMPRTYFGPPPKPVGPDGPYQIQVPDAAALVAKGYAVVSLNYRLDGAYSIPLGADSALQDGKAAVRFLRANAGKYGIDPNRFAVWGNSAGGYVAAMLGVTGDQPTDFDNKALGNADVSSAVQAVVVWFGAIDNLPGMRYSIPYYLWTAKNVPPFLIANGDADPGVTKTNAQRLHDVLKKAGVQSTLTILPGAGHEDPAFMETQMIPTFAFLDKTFGRDQAAKLQDSGRNLQRTP